MYDYILTNPPYIAPDSMRVGTDVLAYEPHKALFSTEKGVRHIERIITHAPKYLSRDGVLYLEHDPEQTKFISICARINGFEAHTHKDQYQTERYTRLTRIISGKVAL